MGNPAAIPLSGIAPPVENPLQTYARLMGVKTMQLQQQAAQQEMQTRQLQQQGLETQNEMQQLQLRSVKGLMRASQGVDWSQPDAFQKFIGNAQQNGVDPRMITPMVMERQKYLLTLGQTRSTDLKNMVDTNNQLLGKIDAIKQATDPQQRAQAARQQAFDVLNSGLDNNPQRLQFWQAVVSGKLVPNDAQLDNVGAGLLDHTTQANLILKGRETSAAEKTANARELSAQNQQKELQAKMPGGALRSPELQAQDAYMAAHPGATALDYQRYIRTLPINTRYSLEANGGAGNGNGTSMTPQQEAARLGVSPAAFDQAAEKYFQTGQLPSIGRGLTGMRLQRLIMDRTAELHPDAQLAPNSAEFKANEASLTNLQKQRDQVISFENTAQKNLDIFLQQAKNVVDAGSPLVNRPLRAVKLAVGDPNVAAYDAARRVAINEIAKVTSNPGLSGQLSDEARREVETFNPASATLAQTYRVAQILKQDMANRHQSYDEQIAAIQGRLRGGQGAPQSSATQQQNQTAAPKFTVGQTVTIKGKPHKITKVYPNGTFDAN